MKILLWVNLILSSNVNVFQIESSYEYRIINSEVADISFFCFNIYFYLCIFLHLVKCFRKKNVCVENSIYYIRALAYTSCLYRAVCYSLSVVDAFICFLFVCFEVF